MSSDVYSWRNRHWRIAEILVYTQVIEIWLFLCSQVVSKYFNDTQIVVYSQGLEISLLFLFQVVSNCCNGAGILDSTSHRYPTHIRSPNYWPDGEEERGEEEERDEEEGDGEEERVVQEEEELGKEWGHT